MLQANGTKTIQSQVNHQVATHAKTSNDMSIHYQHQFDMKMMETDTLTMDTPKLMFWPHDHGQSSKERIRIVITGSQCGQIADAIFQIKWQVE